MREFSFFKPCKFYAGEQVALAALLAADSMSVSRPPLLVHVAPPAYYLVPQSRCNITVKLMPTLVPAAIFPRSVSGHIRHARS